ncbi:MAG: MFS transporter [Anaerolineae bacterium]|nr:MFS transporter [Anaerolineae bacterium]
MEIIRSRERSVLPPLLASAMRRAILLQVGIIAGFETIFVLGALSAERLAGSDRLYGLSLMTPFALGQLLVALPAGRWMDRWGRRSVLLAGAVVEAVSLLVLGLALFAGWPGIFVAGLLLLGLGSGAAQLVYVVGGDLYPPHCRGEGLSLMATFSSVGVVAGPYIVGFVGDAAERLGSDPILAPWFVASLIVAAVAWVIAGLHPDPLDVSRAPGRYYEGLARLAGDPANAAPARALPRLLRLYPIAATVLITVCFQGVRMSIVPLLTFILRARGYSLTIGATMVAAMGFGMILASYPAGRIGDRWGRRRPLLGATLIALACTVAVPLTGSLPLMFAALVILGAAFVTVLNMGRAVITDVTRPAERATTLATTSVAVGVAVIVFPTVAAYVREIWGWQHVAILGAVLLSIVFILAYFLRERGVGRWDHHGVEE